ncbi:MAG: DUF2585 domain-containing protein [Acidobacteriota bacterium]|nr:DUF2585 domain-containing protein [Acidobacteriota bacterium]
MSETLRHGLRGDGARRAWPWLGVLAVLAVAALLLRRQGRLWACACGRLLFWTGEAWGPDTSQHLFDPYSFTHVLHGVVFCGVLAWGLPRAPRAWRLWLAVAAEAAWEVIENTEFVINRYREATAALGYTGDTVVNSLGDVLACALGFLAAQRLGLARSAALFLLIEVVLLVTIRDSLLLNVLMLVYPLDGIREWQAGHS